MPIIDLSKRITFDWDEYNKNARSYESNIFIKPQSEDLIQEGTSVNITIGDVWYNNSKHIDVIIPDKGVKVKSKKYVVFQTQQHFGLPYNVYGIAVGKGINVFSGGVISTCKIVPGYKGKLRIGYYNASNSTIILHKGDVLGCCIFFDTEMTMVNEYLGDDLDNIPALEVLTKWEKIWEWFGDNWTKILAHIITWCLSIVAIIIAYMTYYLTYLASLR